MTPSTFQKNRRASGKTILGFGGFLGDISITLLSDQKAQAVEDLVVVAALEKEAVSHFNSKGLSRKFQYSSKSMELVYSMASSSARKFSGLGGRCNRKVQLWCGSKS